jgi:hypothetical protein
MKARQRSGTSEEVTFLGSEFCLDGGTYTVLLYINPGLTVIRAERKCTVLTKRCLDNISIPFDVQTAAACSFMVGNHSEQAWL